MAAAVCYVPAHTACQIDEALERHFGYLARLEIVHAPKITPEPVTETASWIERLWCVR
jgi:hypothetical protein